MSEKVREALELNPGEELQIYMLDKSIRIQRPRSIKELRSQRGMMPWKDEDRDQISAEFTRPCALPPRWKQELQTTYGP